MESEIAPAKKAKLAAVYNTLAPDELVDPTDENNYIVVELPRPMGIAWRQNPKFGGVCVESMDQFGEAGMHGGLKPNDQLVGVGATAVKGKDLDSCIDQIAGAKKGVLIKLTVFRGKASRLYGKDAPKDAWVKSLLKKVMEGTIEVTAANPAAALMEMVSDVPMIMTTHVEPQFTPEELEERKRLKAEIEANRIRIEKEKEAERQRREKEKEDAKRRMQQKMTAPASDGEASEAEGDAASEAGSIGSAAEESVPSDCDAEVPESFATCIGGKGLEEDLQKCIDNLAELASDSFPRGNPVAQNTASCIRKACIAANSSAWEALEQQTEWKKTAGKRLAAAASARLEHLAELERKRKGQERLASLAQAEADAKERLAEMMANTSLLSLEPAKVLQFDHERKSSLTLRNTASGSVAFRVKTSAAKVVLVEPASGVIEKGGEIRLPIVSTEKTPSVKFLIQATLASNTPNAASLAKEKWAELHSQKKLQEWELTAKF